MQESTTEEMFTHLVEKISNLDYMEYESCFREFNEPDFQDENGNTLLHMCVKYCNYPALLLTMSRGADIERQNNDGLAPLHEAIWKGFLPLAAPLLQAGAQPNVKDHAGRTPLFFAVRRGDIHAIKLLLDFKADPNILHDGKSLLYYASTSGYPESALLLIESGAKTTIGSPIPLVAAMRNGNRELFSVLLKDHEEDILYVDSHGHTILDQALEMKTNLLSVIAHIYQKQAKELQKSFPPEGIPRKQLKELQAALDLNDNLVSIESVKQMISGLKDPWHVPTILESQVDQSKPVKKTAKPKPVDDTAYVYESDASHK